jgi:hypothetical protein
LEEVVSIYKLYKANLPKEVPKVESVPEPEKKEEKESKSADTQV